MVAAEAWFRNPHNYIEELVETGECKIIWDRGVLVKRKLDPVAHASLYFGNAYKWRVIAVGDQGAAELGIDSNFDSPIAVYPVWSYGDEPAILEELLAQPVGRDVDVCNDTTVLPDERPVYGQEHRVFITNIPMVTTGPGRSFLRYLSELQEEYPDAIIHLHGLYSYRANFGMGMRAADVDPRTDAQKGKVILGSGKIVPYERAQSNAKWVTNLGFKPVDLEVPRVRCMFNIKSACWAAANFHLLNSMPQSTKKPIDHASSDNEYTTPKAPVLARGSIAQEGDKFLCNSCSLADGCSYYRDGAVCSLPGAEPTRLAEMFNSRDSGKIIDGLGSLLGRNADRLERGIAAEELDGEISPDVTRMVGQVFDQGVKLAKLVNPALNGGPKVNVSVTGGAAVAIEAGSSTQLMNAAVAELRSQGYRDEDITEEMVLDVIQQMSGGHQTVKGELA